MKKHIASLAVILLAVSSLAFYGCGPEEDADVDPDDTGDEPGEDGISEDGGDGGDGEEEGSNP